MGQLYGPYTRIHALKAMQILWLIVLPAALFIFITMSDTIFSIAANLPPCPFYRIIGLYCPACGNTRSLAALMHGDILQSLRYNITVLFLCILGAAFYAENAINLCGIKIKFVPRSEFFIYLALIVFIAYFIFRNFIPNLLPEV